MPARIDLYDFDNQNFQRGAPGWKEGLWWVARSVFFAPWLPVPSAIKVRILRLFGATMGHGVIIRSRVNITFPWRFECGDYVWIGDEVVILSLAKIRIGSNTCISQRAFLCTGSHDFSRKSFDLTARPIMIGDGCWIGAQSFVGPGVTFGDGSRCLAGAVVVKDVPMGSAVAGVPAQERPVL
jgi:putative colanic acid biosynthesis acetyltransferase WcaF